MAVAKLGTSVVWDQRNTLGDEVPAAVVAARRGFGKGGRVGDLGEGRRSSTGLVILWHDDSISEPAMIC